MGRGWKLESSIFEELVVGSVAEHVPEACKKFYFFRFDKIEACDEIFKVRFGTIISGKHISLRNPKRRCIPCLGASFVAVSQTRRRAPCLGE